MCKIYDESHCIVMLVIYGGSLVFYLYMNRLCPEQFCLYLTWLFSVINACSLERKAKIILIGHNDNKTGQFNLNCCRQKRLIYPRGVNILIWLNTLQIFIQEWLFVVEQCAFEELKY